MEHQVNLERQIRRCEDRSLNKQLNRLIKRMDSLPFEIKCKILEGLPFLSLARFIPLWDAKQERFRTLCRDNHLAVPNGRFTNWGFEFDKYLTSVKEQMYQEHVEINHSPALIGAPTTSRTLYNPREWAKLGHADGLPLTKRTLHCYLLGPRESIGLKRKTYLLESTYVQNKTGFHRNLVLGNEHDLAVQPEEEIFCIENTFDVSSSFPLICDEHDNVYYYKLNNNGFAPHLEFYRRNLCVADQTSEYLFNVPYRREKKILNLMVGNETIYLLMKYENVAELRRYNWVEKSTVSQRFSPNTSDCALMQPIEVHGDLLITTEMMVMDTRKGSYDPPWFIQHRDRFQLNRDTYILVVGNTVEREKDLKTLSIINNQLVYQFVQHCSRDCEIRCFGENLFGVFEENEWYLWFQEKPGNKPYLAHAGRKRFSGM